MPPAKPPENPADTEDRFSIHELATLSGLTTRTVRYYITEG
ncbi:MAG: hypothetical protein RI988_1705, partial [Pseudomonadota bacterium]